MNEYHENLYKTLQDGLRLVESAFSHVSHGGPTRGDAEKWMEQARKALEEPAAREEPAWKTTLPLRCPHWRESGTICENCFKKEHGEDPASSVPHSPDCKYSRPYWREEPAVAGQDLLRRSATLCKAIALYSERSPRVSALPETLMRLVRDLQRDLVRIDQWNPENVQFAESGMEPSQASGQHSDSLDTSRKMDMPTSPVSEGSNVKAQAASLAALVIEAYFNDKLPKAIAKLERALGDVQFAVQSPEHCRYPQSGVMRMRIRRMRRSSGAGRKKRERGRCRLDATCHRLYVPYLRFI